MTSAGARGLRSITVLYNTDYDEELIAASSTDESAVRNAALAVYAALEANGYSVALVGVEGRDLPQVITSFERARPDLVVNLCESLAGDARNELVVPTVLDMLQIPYTGSAAVTLGLCLHKELAKAMLVSLDVATPPHRIVSSEADLAVPLELDYPYFLKLGHEDASVGIEASNLVHDWRALQARARELLTQYRQPVLAERYVEGREFNVTVMGGPEPERLEILPLHEIDFAMMPADRPHIVSYPAKWDETHVDYEGTKPVPCTDLPVELVGRIEQISRRCFTALGLRDYGRVDIRLDADGMPWVIDVNPNCDISPDAGVARAARVAGLDYDALLDKIVRCAWERVCPKS